MADHHEDPSYLPPDESTLENYTGSELPFKSFYVALIVVFAVTIVFAIALVPVRDALVRMSDERAAADIIPSNARPSGPLLQQSPEADWTVWERLMAEQMAGYGWQDRANGIARIPLDAAIEHALDEGLIASLPDAPISNASKLAAAHGTSTHGDSASSDHQATGDHSGGESH